VILLFVVRHSIEREKERERERKKEKEKEREREREREREIVLETIKNFRYFVVGVGGG
jgi:hypothetical protein